MHLKLIKIVPISPQTSHLTMSKYTNIYKNFIKKILIETWIKKLVKFKKNASSWRI